MRRARVGHSNRSSPMPVVATRSSLSADSGQPPPGKTASSSGCPVGWVVDRETTAWPRQTRRVSSRRSRATTDVMVEEIRMLYIGTVFDLSGVQVKSQAMSAATTVSCTLRPTRLAATRATGRIAPVVPRDPGNPCGRRHRLERGCDHRLAGRRIAAAPPASLVRVKRRTRR